MRLLPKFCLIAALILAFVLPQSGFAQTTTTSGQNIRAITTAVPFLLIAPDSRHGALGEAGVALTDDANATHWNLSGLAFSEKQMGFGLSYTPWLRQLVPDINLAYLNGYYNMGDKKGVVASSLRFFSLGRIIFTDENAVQTGEFNASEFALDAGYTRKVTQNFSAGVALRFIYSNLAANARVGALDTRPGTSIAGDINMMYNKDFSMKTAGQELPVRFRWGLNISNIGAKISYTNSNNRDFIPTNLRTGFLLRGNVDEYNSIGLTADFNKLLVPSAGGQADKTLIDGIFSSFGDAKGGFSEELAEIQTSIGLEYWYNNLFAVRAGYFYEDPIKGARKFITLGAGIRYQVFGLDFAYLAPLSQNHPLQNTLRFSLTFDFDPAGNM
ncbi:MAG: type IX secretion system outer membrane channel protein PorV [Bacteroidia bacterium]|nr:type IX secretion system outer membrane channel protein PorV [Bacteroidia bacterium]